MIFPGKKGQMLEESEILIKAVVFIMVTLVFVGGVTFITTYQITYESRPDYRNLIDFTEVLLGSNCVAYENKDSQSLMRGILDKEKLDKFSFDCINFEKKPYIIIQDERGGSWSFGAVKVPGSGSYIIRTAKDSLSYAVLIKYPESIVSARMDVFV